VLCSGPEIQKITKALGIGRASVYLVLEAGR
jgi:hypothetical protein